MPEAGASTKLGIDWNMNYIEGFSLSDSIQGRLTSECNCPVSCKYTTVRTSASYGSTSNFDMAKMLEGNTTDLQKRYVKAREINQRVNTITMNLNRRQITAFDSVVHRLDKVINETKSRLERGVHELHEVLEVVEKRAEFHAARALHGVRYMVEYNFKRYWQLQSERAIDHVTTEFYPFSHSIERVVKSLCENANGSNEDVEVRNLKWYPIENQVLNKLDLLSRVLDVLRDVNESYTTAHPLGNYKYTPGRTYDYSFLSIELFEPKDRYRESYFKHLIKHTEDMKLYLERFISIGRECVQNQTYDSSLVTKTVSSYEYVCKRYNYYVFLLNDRIISNPLELINGVIAHFETLRQNLHDDHHKLEDIVTWLTDILDMGNSGFLHDIRSLSLQCMTYLSNTSKTKTELAQLANTDTTSRNIQNATQLLNNLQSRGQEFADGLKMVERSFLALYAAMIQEPTTKTFYTRMNNEVTELLQNRSTASYYMPWFERLLRHSFEGQNYEELIVQMNADLVHLNLTWITYDTNKIFADLLMSTDVSAIMGTIVNDFETAVNELRQSLSLFLEGNEINAAFFK